MSSDEIVKTDRVVLSTDVHNFSIATKVLAQRQYDFLQELYEALGESEVRRLPDVALKWHKEPLKVWKVEE